MNRFVASLVIVVVFVGICMSVAATDNGPLPADAKLSGKAVIVERAGWILDVKENVRFESVGSKDFVVIPMSYENSKTYDYWISAEQIVGLKVFDKLEDAQAHLRRSYPDASTSDHGGDDRVDIPAVK